MEPKRALIVADVHPYIQQRLEEFNYWVDVIPEISKEKLSDILPAYSLLIITTYTIIDKPLIDKTINLELIGRVGSGMENVDVESCLRKGIICVNSPEGNANAVGEHCLAMLLALLNNIVKSNNELRNNIFLREENRGEELDGKTIGIIGYGHTGSTFAKKLCGFDVEIFAYDKYNPAVDDKVKNVSLKELQEKCDVISFHVPYNKETHHYCDAKFISACKKDPVIINTSRGAIINTLDVLHGLETQQVKGLCIDVYEGEPVTKNKIHSPEIYNKLLSFDNVIATPHIAGWTIESKYKLAKVLMDKIEKALNLG
ncbi:MAG: D-isomer specific 2-hydroxyacid dehydrogenase NAD-binding [Bacteroidota bacterium]|nr:D-isomer specific 2-hydroxyacid dehydrogenase NAD-binding [Bacteroidota bacterium]